MRIEEREGAVARRRERKAGAKIKEMNLAGLLNHIAQSDVGGRGEEEDEEEDGEVGRWER